MGDVRLATHSLPGHGCRGCRGVELAVVTCLAVAVFALSLAWRLPGGGRTEVRVSEELRHAAFAWWPTGPCVICVCPPLADTPLNGWMVVFLHASVWRASSWDQRRMPPMPPTGPSMGPVRSSMTMTTS